MFNKVSFTAKCIFWTYIFGTFVIVCISPFMIIYYGIREFSVNITDIFAPAYVRTWDRIMDVWK